jgi:uncharacterized protein (TIGR02453 family)
MTQFQPIFDFLRRLRQNNNHEWFELHRTEYDQARMLFEEFIQGLIFRFDTIEPLGDLAAKDAIFRINNNLRFARNMPPYKNHLSAVLAPGGRHSLQLPYYIHIMPDGGSLIAGGAHMPTSSDLQAIRSAIARDPVKIGRVIEAPAFRKYFAGISGEKLKTAPRGYAVDDPQIELIRHKQFMVHHSLSDEQVLGPDFADHAMAVFAAMKPFLDYLQPLVGPQMRPTRVPPKREEGMTHRERKG